MDKISGLARQYSQGDFSATATLRSSSSLNGLSNNLTHMALQLDNLMQSHTALTRFVAHECRLPLSRMLFSLESLTLDNKEDLYTNIEELSALIDQFLMYSKIQQNTLNLTLKVTNISPWLHKLVDEHQKYALDKIIMLTSHFDVCIAIDEYYLKHAISNLLTNALKYAKSKINVSYQTQNNQLLLLIEDDGVVIPDDDKAKIFNPFYQADVLQQESSDGYGIGLSIAYSVISLHNGDITVQNSSLGGTAFLITLPII